MNRPQNLRGAILWLLRACTLVVAGFSLLVLVAAALAMEWAGQHNLATAFAMFLPRWIWALPLAMTVPPLLLLHWKAGLGALAAVCLYWGPWMGYGWLGSKLNLETAADVRVLTWNRGQANGESLQPFKNQTRPDLIAMQDAGRRLAGYLSAPEYADLPHGAEAGEFLLLSRYPVRATGLLSFPAHPGLDQANYTTVAARFEVDAPSGTLAFYNVHFPTPRDTLSFYRRGIPLYGIIGIPGTGWGRKRENYQAYWDGQGNLHRQLIERLKSEKLPKIVAGDFNTPAFGPWHRMYTELLNDSHAEGGSGYGHTFPGKTGNPLALFQSWLRIDRILADNTWCLACQVTESDRASQHLAVFAAYRRQ